MTKVNINNITTGRKIELKIVTGFRRVCLKLRPNMVVALLIVLLPLR